MGESGSGKSTSLRNFNPDEVGIFNIAGKPLPFRKKFPVINGGSKDVGSLYTMIENALDRAKKLSYVVDDSGYLMSFEEFDRAKEIGYTKYTEMATKFAGLVRHVQTIPDDVIVYFIMHTENLEGGKVKAKTMGKMIDSKLTLEGLFTIVLLCGTDGKDHWFDTQSDGFTTAKSPMEMFDTMRIPNDLKAVDTIIREYYELKKPENYQAKPEPPSSGTTIIESKPGQYDDGTAPIKLRSDSK